jgi:3'-5' exoribonuclease
MTQRVNIDQLEPKKEITSSFRVKYLNLAQAKDGKFYLNIILTDATGDLESRIWNNAETIAAELEKGDYVQVSGKLNLYQGKKQFIISDIAKLEMSEINKEEFIMKSNHDPEKMYSELKKIVDELSDVYIKELLSNVLNDGEIARRLKLWQAGKTIHHAYQSGLLEHVLSCAKLAVSLSNVYQVNSSYVVAGAILHDLCKIYELTDGDNVEYTEEGKLVGHLVKALEIIDRFSYRIQNFPYQMKLHLKHIMLSHHGEYEYGSPKIPQTKEAMLVHLIDHMDSKMNAFDTIKKTDNNIGHWSGYVKHLDRIVFKGELPTFTKKLTGDSKASSKNPKKKSHQKEIKQSLGGLLKDFKVESDE